MRVSIAFFVFAMSTFSITAQTLVGTWQQVKQTTCLEEKMPEGEDGTTLTEEMRTMSDASQRIIVFKENKNGEENIRLIQRRKPTGTSTFQYKYNGTTLYILDKKSQTLIAAYDVETLTADSLIFSNTKRACETRVFIRLK